VIRQQQQCLEYQQLCCTVQGVQGKMQA
jgi:hypothetical protein